MFMKTVLYYLAISALFTHELDAVINREWRLLFHIFEMSEIVSSTLFIFLHFPLFYLFFHFGHHSSIVIRNYFRKLVCYLLVIHGFVHFLLSGHEHYYFEGVLSNFYIFGSALFAVAYLAIKQKTPKLNE